MRRLIVALLLVFSAPTLSLAWGDKGHKAVAEIAYGLLNDNARDEVDRLLGGNDEFIAAAVWADKVRFNRPETAKWHYADIPMGSDGVYDAARDCANNDCAVARITEFSGKMADKQLVKGLRIEALKWVIHFVGDIHQPLHAANDNDRGGNEVWVRLNNKTNKLHSIWDTALVDEIGDDSSEVAEKAVSDISDQEMRDWSRGTPQASAEESFKVARDFIYARSRGVNTKQTPIILPPSYADDATPIVTERIAMAGVRLAFVINQALGR
jgi:nuclease S1